MSSSSAMCVDDAPMEEAKDEKANTSNGNDMEKNDNEPVNLDEPVTVLEEIKFLMEYFTAKTYNAQTEDLRADIAITRCIELAEKDYKVVIVDNSGGKFSQYYPTKLIFFENELSTNSIPEDIIHKDALIELLRKAHNARVRTRFPVPVILFKGKYVLRSSTLAGLGESIGRLGLGYVMSTEANEADGTLDRVIAGEMQTDSSQNLPAIEESRSADRLLLQQFNVGTIVDLMVEKRKHKLGVPVTSSEKNETESNYSKFKLIAFPYPGCEFFTSFHNMNFDAEGLKFNWNQAEIDVTLTLPSYPRLDYLNINWENYAEWDIVQITQNYLKYILKYLQDNDSGILIHCISGWDRTPLFISMIRLSLWADGLVHKSLNEEEILYFTLTYDWLLFGHRLTDRLKKQEDILLFCFYFLKYIYSDEFSLLPARSKVKKQEKIELPSEFSDPSSNGNNSEANGNLRKSPIKTLDDNGFLPMELNEPLGASSTLPLLYLPHSPERPISALSDKSDELSPLRQRGSPVNIGSRTGLKVGSYGSPSSLSSWGIVTSTGSLQSNSDIDLDRAMENFTALENESATSRETRLSQVRSMFYKIYYSTSGKEQIQYFGKESITTTVGNTVGCILGFGPKTEEN